MGSVLLLVLPAVKHANEGVWMCVRDDTAGTLVRMRNNKRPADHKYHIVLQTAWAKWSSDVTKSSSESVLVRRELWK